MSKLPTLLQQVHTILQTCLRNGDIAIDATAGNGHDSVFLAQQVAPSGLVYSFDIQSAAINATHNRLVAADLRQFVLLNQHSHAQMAAHIAPEHVGKIKAVMFNLGYLPSGDKTIVTQVASTLAAVQAATELITIGGVISIMAYPGHAGGEVETSQLASWLQQLSADNFSLRTMNSPYHQASAPRLFVLQKQA